MAIESLETPPRQLVLWIDQPVPTTVQAALRGMGLLPTTIPLQSLAAAKLQAAAAVVFTQDSKKPLQINAALAAHAAELLDSDCHVFVRLSSAGAQAPVNYLAQKRLPHVLQGIGAEIPFPHVFLIGSAANQRQLAQLLATRISYYSQSKTRPAGLAINPPEVDKGLPHSTRKLLERAFSDCSHLHLQPLADGNSNSDVFIAHATIAETITPGPPQPFFLKLGSRETTLKEWRNYVEAVHVNLPFHLAPRLALQRCALGAKQGILVGDFVEDSESLAECSRGSRASTPVGTLFDRTLRGWHAGAEVKVVPNLERTLSSLTSKPIPVHRYWGAMNSPGRLKRKLAQLVSAQTKIPFFTGRTHGDMHANNIRVRGSDSVLIDFLASRNDLCLKDPAALEVSLLVRAPSNEDFDASAWNDLAANIYTKKALSGLLSGTRPDHRYAWIAYCIHQIRLHALTHQFQPGQYALVVSHYLYYAATKDKGAAGPEDYRRAAALSLSREVSQIAWP